MRIYSKKGCTHYKPMANIPSIFSSEPTCKHCAHYSTKNCHKDYFDALEYPEEYL